MIFELFDTALRSLKSPAFGFFFGRKANFVFRFDILGVPAGQEVIFV
jgi:hypothetical protein